ncbi:MAG: thioredoxin domain-containing protein [Anaerolineae bacterium]|nr:thioredoxin domain-containing protein [Anaerolineae bacterium]
MYPQIVSDYVLTGKVRYVFRNFPMSYHTWAQKAAEAAECAGEQGQYWEMHDALFSSQGEWSSSQDAVPVFKGLAANLKLDQAQFDSCIDGDKYTERIQADTLEGIQAGVSGTPSFSVNGVLVVGAQPFDAFKEKIEYALAGGEAPSLTVPADSYRSMGKADAPLVITEFSDYQCSACGYVANTVIPEFIKRYVDTGRVRFVYRDFPLGGADSTSHKGAEAAFCAGKQGYYWEMNEKLFSSQSEWGAEGADLATLLRGYAAQIGMDTDAFNECLDSGEAALVIQGDFLSGEQLGVNATPYFFVGDVPIRGGLPIDAFSIVIDYVAEGGSGVNIVPVGSWNVQGNPQTAKAVTVAFIDYANAESRQHALETLPQLKQTYVDTGQMLYVIHPWAASEDAPGSRGAVAAVCASQQDKGWEMHTKLFEEQDKWAQAADPQPLFASYAQGLGLDMTGFEECLGSQWAKLQSQSGNVVAAMYGVPGAPTFMFNNGQSKAGSPTFAEFKTIIDSIVSQ